MVAADEDGPQRLDGAADRRQDLGERRSAADLVDARAAHSP
ncbi:MAG: hypothetical protein ACXW08_07280 [Solirubrobacteraceae bacterium]